MNHRFLFKSLILSSLIFGSTPNFASEASNFEQKKEKLIQLITHTGKDGIGITSYHNALCQLEHSTESDETKVQKLRTIEEALAKQIAATGNKSFLELYSEKRPGTDYCMIVEDTLTKLFEADPNFKEHCLICLTVLKDGTISKLRIDPEDHGVKSYETMVLNKVASLKKLAPPPYAPLDLNVEICKALEHTDCSFVQKIDYCPYVTLVQRRMKQNWHPPKEKQSNSVVVRFQILRDGSVKNEKVVKSHDATLDQVALNTIRKCAPFLKLPDGSEKCIDIEFTFKYNVYNK